MNQNRNQLTGLRAPALTALLLLALASLPGRAPAQDQPPNRRICQPATKTPDDNRSGGGDNPRDREGKRHKEKPFSHLVVFGDSLSDTGNYYRLSGGYPPPPYADGRFCDGPLWVEYLAADLGMCYKAADNFAVAGATTGTLNINDTTNAQYPGLAGEIAIYQGQGPVTEPERALYIVEAGADDFFAALAVGEDPQQLIGNGVQNTIAAIRELRATGARLILVVNVPDLGVTPYALGAGLGPQVTQLASLYNAALASALDDLAHAGIPTIRVDMFAVLDQLVENPGTYGFSDVTTPWLYSDMTESPDGFLFWDTVHPTTGAHRVLAWEAREDILRALCPGCESHPPYAHVDAPNGSVTAWLHHN